MNDPDENPYLIPEDGFHRTINFSGGRSSAYMLKQIADVNDLAARDDVAVCFCNTGKEREETLVFVKKVAEYTGVNVVWLEYDYDNDAKGGRKFPKNIYHVVDFDTASREGEPYATLNEKANILPNPTVRKCTVELKIETTRRYCLREFGWYAPQTKRIVGFRHDEKKRWAAALLGPKKPKKGKKSTCDLEFPMVYAGVEKWDVNHFWKNVAPFDLGIASSRGNCDLCFLKSVDNLVGTIRAEPHLADWWIGQEKNARDTWGQSLRKKEMARFTKRWSYEELRDMAYRTPELNLGIFKDSEDDQADEGVSCFCTD